MKNLIVIAIIGLLAACTSNQNTVSQGKAASATAKEACFHVEGMTCATCELTVKKAVGKLDGIYDVFASTQDKNAIVHYKPSQTNPEEIKNKIDSAGYKATAEACTKSKS